MTADIVKLEPNPDPHKVVKILEELLNDAKGGEIEAVVIVCVKDGYFTTRHSGCNSLELVGALHFAQHYLMLDPEQ